MDEGFLYALVARCPTKPARCCQRGIMVYFLRLSAKLVDFCGADTPAFLNWVNSLFPSPDGLPLLQESADSFLGIVPQGIFRYHRCCLFISCGFIQRKLIINRKHGGYRRASARSSDAVDGAGREWFD